jgi:hypothetical protein
MKVQFYEETGSKSQTQNDENVQYPKIWNEENNA